MKIAPSQTSHILIPDLIRDLGFDLIQGRVHDLGRRRFFMVSRVFFQASSSLSSRIALKSPLERGGPLAVGSVFFETPLLNRPRQVAVFLWICSCSFPAKRNWPHEVRLASAKGRDWPAQQTGFLIAPYHTRALRLIFLSSSRSEHHFPG